MKTQNLKQTHAVPLPVDRAALVLHEQLALKRLKELPLWVKPKNGAAFAGRALKLCAAFAAAVLAALFKRAEPTRRVAPGQPPIHCHELERVRALRALNLL